MSLGLAQAVLSHVSREHAALRLLPGGRRTHSLGFSRALGAASSRAKPRVPLAVPFCGLWLSLAVFHHFHVVASVTPSIGVRDSQSIPILPKLGELNK